MFGLLLLACQSAQAELSKAGKSAEETLRRAKMFQDAHVGYAATTPKVVHAFRRLLEEKDAAPAFRRLLKNGTLAGQLYALCGLRVVDRPYFKRVVGRYAKDRRRVKTQHGCMITSSPVSELVKRKGAVRLADGQSLMDWVKKNKAKSFHYDIRGGGYSDMFRR
jgi:hypothetical protein